MDIYETIKKSRRIYNDFDYRRAKVDLSKLNQVFARGQMSYTSKAQLLSNAITEYEQRTMDKFF